MKRILLKKGDNIRKFVSFRIAEKDGSIYISFVRKAESRSQSYYNLDDVQCDYVHLETRQEMIPAGIDISYHTTGRIKYKNTLNPSIFAEPLINVTQNFWFASVVTPEFERLEPHMMATRADDVILPLRSSNSVRAQFDFCISAFGSPITTYGWERGHFLWPNFYTLNVIVSDQPIPAGPSSENGFWLLRHVKACSKNSKYLRKAR